MRHGVSADPSHTPDHGSAHCPDHTRLLICGERERMPQRVQAVVVPSNRLAESLTFAVGLAAQLRAVLLVVCSGDADPEAAVAMMQGAPGAAMRLSDRSSGGSGLLTAARADPYGEVGRDTAEKRNLGLLVARMLGWRRVLFLDDDITDLPEREVRTAAGIMAATGLRAMGWHYPDFPDNSVVCHARRAAGLEQGVFIGGGALLVDTAGRLPFFPSVYNEDWLFWYPHLAPRLVGLVGEVKQAPYDPYDTPERAAAQEFGDVLAEGLTNLVHVERSVLIAQLPGYWGSVLEARRQMLTTIRGRLRQQPETAERQRQLASLDAAYKQLKTITPEALAEFVGAWSFDLFRWNLRLLGLTQCTRLADALSLLPVTEVRFSGSP